MEVVAKININQDNAVTYLPVLVIEKYWLVMDSEKKNILEVFLQLSVKQSGKRERSGI